MTDYTAFNAAFEQAGDQPQQAMAALEALTRDVVGVKLFTIMTADTVGKNSERIYTNLPDVYPTSGTKPYNETRWSDITLNQKQTFVANTIEDIATVFDDHDIIQSLGLGSVINVPIMLDGEVVGTINCLHETGYYTPERVAAAEAIKLPGAVCMLLHKLNRAEAA